MHFTNLSLKCSSCIPEAPHFKGMHVCLHCAQGGRHTNSPLKVFKSLWCTQRPVCKHAKQQYIVKYITTEYIKTHTKYFQQGVTQGMIFRGGLSGQNTGAPTTNLKSRTMICASLAKSVVCVKLAALILGLSIKGEKIQPVALLFASTQDK